MYVEGTRTSELQLSPLEESMARRLEERPSRVNEPNKSAEGIRYVLL
ncbi:MAG: hypothetical protein ABSC90_04080 [Acidimicrobiales bacterium]|jgi:hypothetical protein